MVKKTRIVPVLCFELIGRGEWRYGFSKNYWAVVKPRRADRDLSITDPEWFRGTLSGLSGLLLSG